MSLQKECRGMPSSFTSGAVQPDSRNRQEKCSDAMGSLSLRGISGAGVTGHLSTWPAHITSHTVQPGRRHPLPPEARIHGCREESSGSVSKPRFLEQLENYLRRELQTLDPSQPDAQECRLQAYQEVFGYFIEDFKTYKPLLAAIKNEYEVTLAHLRGQIRSLEPLRAMLATVSEQCEQRVLALGKEERAEVRALKQERSRLLWVIEEMRESQTGLQAQVSRLQEELAAQYLLYREERDARKLLVADISNMRCLQEDQKSPKQEVEAEEDVVRLRLALRVAREDLTRLQVELNRVQAEYGDVVPRRDWEQLDSTHRDAMNKLEVLQKDYAQVKLELDALLGVHRPLAQERDSLQAELQRFRSVSTPRPRWDRCQDVISGGSERWAQLSQGQSSDQLVGILLEELTGGVSREKDIFDGLGTGEHVPVYLRYDGQIRNLRLKKADIVNTIKEVWKEKTTEDEQREDRSSLAEFLRGFLEKQYGERAAQWAYSLVEGCRQHRDDDFISLFLSILTGKVDESVYHGQIRLLSHLLKELIHSDATESGCLTPPELSEALRRAFPLKTEGQIEELVQAAQAQLEATGGSIAYQALFNEDGEGKPGAFIKLVRNQANAEKRKYLTELRTQLCDKDKVEVAELRTAIQSIDPSIDPQTLDGYLSLAFKTPTAQLEQTPPLDTDSVVQRLLAADVRRVGPPQAQP
ncbi:translin-associated factor X-interacting protein 1 [Amia ocellicauda]|uniref:translin-associated factor X-interacting protein 1 n=1 Tax=Amia ocellicauda TaxID=2972642 RepID=UPI0034644EC4